MMRPHTSKKHDRILSEHRKNSMKSLLFPIVFAFCFVIKLAGTKAVPTDETPSSDRFQNKTCHGCSLPSAACPQKPIYVID